jgi:hypothetical protein
MIKVELSDICASFKKFKEMAEISSSAARYSGGTPPLFILIPFMRENSLEIDDKAGCI